MKKTKDYTIVTLLLCFGMAVLANLPGCYKGINEDKGHTCKWELCPYKGVTMFDRHEAITEYTGCEEGSDCYAVDWLHFEHPTYEYDQLDSLLFSAMK